MDNEFEDDPGQFRLKMDDGIDEPSISLNVDELRLEKISQRVTFISILIPVLIIIVLVIAYLDIKKRMSYTEDTGTMEFQKLSSDLESRFGSLSLRQAKLEEALVRFSENQNKSMANSNVKLDQLGKTMDALERQFVTQKVFKQVQGDFDQQENALRQEISAVAQNVDQADQQIADMTQELKAQIARIGETLAARNQRLEELEQRVAEVDSEKIDREGFDLMLRLATLKIQQDLKVELDALNAKMEALDKRISQLSTQKDATPTLAPPRKAVSQPIQQPPAGIEEQTIK